MKIIKKISAIFLAFLFVASLKSVSAQRAYAFECSGKSAYLMDYDSKSVVFKHNEEERLPIASMTKIMLLDIVFSAVESGELLFDDCITVSENASGMGGSQVFLQANKKYKVNDLIKCVVIASANDASVALAEQISGSEENFVLLMNEKAAEYGLKNTLFSNCTGLPKATQYSCAKDVAKMFCALLSHDDYFRYSGIWLDELVHPDGSKTTLTNTNKLAKFYSGCDGGKTGFTSESRFCLAATAKRGDMRLVAVVIGENDSKTRFKDVSDMFNNGFNGYKSTTVLPKDSPCDVLVSVKGAKDEKFECYPEENVNVFSGKNDKVDYKVEKIVYENLQAPMRKGDAVGEAVLFVNGVENSRVKLVIGCDVERLGYSGTFSKIAGNW